MSTPRKLGVALCLLGFLAVCVLALVLNTGGPFAGLPGIESDLADQAAAIVAADAPEARVTADGRVVIVELPEFVNPTFDRQKLRNELSDIDGVRSVEILGEPEISGSPIGTSEPEPTAEAEAEPTEVPEPTAEAEAEPTEVPEPTAEAEAEPTEVPEPEPTPEPEPPSLIEIVEGLDLSAVSFEVGAARLTAPDTAVLDGIADQFQGVSGGTVQVQVHTDNLGDPDVNLLLSQDRAEAVVNYLIDRGVDASLLTSRGFGAQVPIADNSTEQGRASNQRVEFVVEGN